MSRQTILNGNMSNKKTLQKNEVIKYHRKTDILIFVNI